MDKRPKRRRMNDNPYYLSSENNHYYISFIDSRNISNTIEVSEELFNTFNQFELDDVSYLNKYQSHYDFYITPDDDPYDNVKNKPRNVEDVIRDKLLKEAIKEVLDTLPEKQARRIIKHYYLNKTYSVIADEENCSGNAANKSVFLALNKLKNSELKYWI